MPVRMPALRRCGRARTGAERCSTCPRRSAPPWPPPATCSISRGAAHRFRTALTRGVQFNQQRWVDAIPPLVFLGECYYQQGAIAQALEQYDAALMVALAFPTWSERLRAVDGVSDGNSDPRGIAWAKLTRRTQLLRLPQRLAVTLDPNLTKAMQAAGLGPGGNSALRLDVSEVLRCLAIALQRRHHLLGPLARYSPLSAPLAQAFRQTPPAAPAWIVSSYQALHGLAILAMGDEAQAKALLNAASSIDSQTDYVLTPQVLIALASLDIKQGNANSAITRLSDASIRAAQLDQIDSLSDTLPRIGQLACAGKRADLLSSFQSAVAWCQNVSALAYLTSGALLSELALESGNVATHEASAMQVLTVLKNTDLVLPRVQAQVGYALAKAAAAQKRVAFAEQQIQTSIGMLRGSTLTGAATPLVFQTQLTLELINRGSLPAAEGETVFGKLLLEPTQDQWQVTPLDCLTRIATVHLPAYEKWLELAVQREAVEDVVVRMDMTQRERFYEILPLGGRVLAARQILHADVTSLPPAASGWLAGVLKANPLLMQIMESQRTELRALHEQPWHLDEQGLSADAKRQLNDLSKTADATENALMALALERSQIPRHIPEPTQLLDLQQTIGERDVVISFVHTPTAVHGLAVTRLNRHIWTVADTPSIDNKIALLLTQIGISSAPNLDTRAADLPWRQTARALATTLVPAAARQFIDAAERVIIVPNGNLWYVPFDLLPLSDSDQRTPLIERHATCFLPTLAHVNLLRKPAPTLAHVAGIFGSLFSADRALNLSLTEQITQRLPQSITLDASQKPVLTAPRWLRQCADQLWVASELPMAATPWELRVIPLEPNLENALANWIQSPLRGPAHVFLPGMQTGAQRIALRGGNELFVPACAFLASGVRCAWLSRWKVGGQSSQLALSRLLEELQYEAPSSAWQRATLALWAENLPTALEPSVPAAKALPATMEGNHPLLWSGYLLIGDHPPPNGGGGPP